MAQKKKIRLSDIAAKLNISTVTVSKALADKEGVGEWQIKTEECQETRASGLNYMLL